MTSDIEVHPSVNKTYQSIGEFVVVFQWIENQYREIGWIILDPHRTNWPPRALRRESNRELIDKVTELAINFLQDMGSREDSPGFILSASDLIELKSIFHDLAKFRNNLLHSSYVEVKAGGVVGGLIQGNPRVTVDPDTGKINRHFKPFSHASITERLKQIANAALSLSIFYTQIRSWALYTEYQQ